MTLFLWKSDDLNNQHWSQLVFKYLASANLFWLIHGNSVLQTGLFYPLGYLETKLAILGDVFFPYQRILISHCREIPEASNTLGFQVCLGGPRWWRKHISGCCCHTAETLQIQTWMGCFKPGLFAVELLSAVTSPSGHFLCVVLEFLSFVWQEMPTHACVLRYAGRCVGMAKISVLFGNSFSIWPVLLICQFLLIFLHSHLEYNSLTEVNSGSLYGLSSLHQLHLSNNSISRINPDGWSFCQKLHEL